MVFEYQMVKTSLAQIEIDDIGNCCLLQRNSLGEESYLYIITEVGSTQVVQYGPIVPDMESLPQNVSYSYQRFDFNERRITKIIQQFVGLAEYVEECDINDIIQNMRPPIENLEHY